MNHPQDARVSNAPRGAALSTASAQARPKTPAVAALFTGTKNNIGAWPPGSDLPNQEVISSWIDRFTTPEVDLTNCCENVESPGPWRDGPMSWQLGILRVLRKVRARPPTCPRSVDGLGMTWDDLG